MLVVDSTWLSIQLQFHRWRASMRPPHPSHLETWPQSLSSVRVLGTVNVITFRLASVMNGGGWRWMAVGEGEVRRTDGAADPLQ
jgi:hypothetical protein